MTHRFHALDAFRGICAISVVLFHLHLTGSITEWPFFKQAEIFVEFFFVLSGFVLAHGYGYKEKLPFVPFLQARMWRLFPLHVVMLLVFIGLEVGKWLAFEYAGLSFNTSPFSGQNHVSEILPNLLLIQSWFGSFDYLSFNYPAWSISVEFYLYLILYCTLTLFSQRKQVSWLVIAIVSLSLLASNQMIITSQALTGLACFFSGATTYVIFRKIHHYRLSKTSATLLEGLMIFCTVIVVIYEIPFKPVASALLFSCVVLMFAFEGGWLSTLLLKSPLQYAGKLSYSIYMTHAAVLFCLQSMLMVVGKLTGVQFTHMIEQQRYLTLGNETLNNLAVFVIVAFVLLVSHFTYHYIELVGQRLGKKKAMKPSKLASVSSTA